jgi:hypothetical protein
MAGKLWVIWASEFSPIDKIYGLGRVQSFRLCPFGGQLLDHDILSGAVEAMFRHRSAQMAAQSEHNVNGEARNYELTT